MVLKNIRHWIFYLFFIYLLIWILVHNYLTSQFPDNAKLPTLKDLWKHDKTIKGIVNDISFWSTSFGIVIYIWFEVIIVSLTLFAFSKLFKYVTSFSKCLLVVIAAHNIFLLQHIFECLFVIKNAQYFNIVRRENFSLFSISFFLNEAKVSFNTAFYYAFGVINVFEFIYWGLLIFFTMKIHHTNSANAIRLISFSYIPILFLWIITVTFINLMNS